MRCAVLASLVLALAAPVMAQAPASAPAPVAALPTLMGPALNVSDIDRSLHFYVDGLGMKLATRRPGPERIETILLAGGGSLLLMSDAHGAHPAIVQGTGFDRLVVRVASLDATIATLKAAGFTAGPVHDAMGGRVHVMRVTDPDGYRLEVIEMNGMPGAGK